jgi:hypothetical protein
MALAAQAGHLGLFIFEARGPQETAESVAVPEPTRRGGRIRNHRTRGDSGVLSNREVGSGATRHVAALDPTLIRRPDPIVHETWRRMNAHAAFCLNLKLICRNTRS